MRPAAGTSRAAGFGARSRRRDARWQYDDYGNPIIQGVFNASPPRNRLPSSHRHYFPGSHPYASPLYDDYVHTINEHGRHVWEPRVRHADRRAVPTTPPVTAKPPVPVRFTSPTPDEGSVGLAPRECDTALSEFEEEMQAFHKRYAELRREHESPLASMSFAPAPSLPSKPLTAPPHSSSTLPPNAAGAPRRHSLNDSTWGAPPGRAGQMQTALRSIDL